MLGETVKFGICALYIAVAYRLGIMKYPEGETQRDLEEE
jgi:hypothetical protein